MGKVEVWQLRQRQSLPLEAKIISSQRRIMEWYEHWQGNAYVSFSGGKDSTVLRHLAAEVCPDVPSVFVDTGLEHPEIKAFVRESNATIIKPKMSYRQVIEKYGYPVVSKEQAQYIREYRETKSERLRAKRWNGESGKWKISEKWKFLVNAPFRVSERCCYVMKKAPFQKYEKQTSRKPMLGTMASDSLNRHRTYLRSGCNAFDRSRPVSTPLGFWTEQDVLEYLANYHVPYCSVYGVIIQDEQRHWHTTGEETTGCMWCAFGVHKEREPNRFQRMKVTHPKIYRYCMEELKLCEVLEYIGIPH